MKRNYALAVDLGGTNTRVALVRRGEKGAPTIAAKRSMPTPMRGGPDAFVSGVGAMTDELLISDPAARKRIRGAGVGAPGPVDVRRGVVFSLPNVPGWRNVPLKKRLERRLRMPVLVDNDANAMAQGEFFFGAARGARNAVFLTLGTGLGGGLLLNGALFCGRSFSAAEIGHMRYRAGGDKCSCGARGCIDTVIGNRRLLAKLRRDLARGVRTRIRRMTGAGGPSGARLEMVSEAARRGDRYARRFWAEAGAALGDFLAGIANLLNPEIIVVGGGMAGAGRFVLDPIRRALAGNAFPAASAGLRIVKARFGADAGLLGSASLVFAGSV